MCLEGESICIGTSVSGIAECVIISAGVAAAVLEPEPSPDELVSQADGASYQAKEFGRNRIVGPG